MNTIQQLFDLSGKVAIVTGGAQGIGQGIAYRLSEAGANVLISDINLALAQQVASSMPTQASAVEANVSNANDVENTIKAAVDTYSSLDILVNNAGIYPFKTIADMTEDEWDRVLDVNLKGTFLCTKMAAMQMSAQGTGGVIVNIASIDALHPSMVGLPHYDSSKGGMLMFTKSAALEFAPQNIRINAIAPGGIQTPGSGAGTVAPEVLEAFKQKIPLGRMGEPDDIGRVALFLASEASSYMTGEMIVVDGGYLLG